MEYRDFSNKAQQLTSHSTFPIAAYLNSFGNRKISFLFLVLTIRCHVTTVCGDVAMTWFTKQSTRIGRTLLGIGRAVSANCTAELQRNQTYEGWNFNSGNYLFTTDTKLIHVSKFYCPSM